MIGLGSQDDFDQAVDFLGDTGVETPQMLWDPTFQTWLTLGVSVNSQMIMLTPEAEAASNLFYGFGDTEQAAILDLASEFPAAG